MIRQYTTFKLDGQLFGIDVLLVREINQQMEITNVPQTPESVKGLINLRGQIVTVLDLGKRLGLEMRRITADSHIIILKTEEELNPLMKRIHYSHELSSSEDVVGLLVDEIGDVIVEDEEKIDIPPANIGDVDGSYLSGVIKLDEQLLILLDVAEILGIKSRDNIES